MKLSKRKILQTIPPVAMAATSNLLMPKFVNSQEIELSPLLPETGLPNFDDVNQDTWAAFTQYNDDIMPDLGPGKIFRFQMPDEPNTVRLRVFLGNLLGVNWDDFAPGGEAADTIPDFELKLDGINDENALDATITSDLGILDDEVIFSGALDETTDGRRLADEPMFNELPSNAIIYDRRRGVWGNAGYITYSSGNQLFTQISIWDARISTYRRVTLNMVDDAEASLAQHFIDAWIGNRSQILSITAQAGSTFLAGTGISVLAGTSAGITVVAFAAIGLALLALASALALYVAWCRSLRAMLVAEIRAEFVLGLIDEHGAPASPDAVAPAPQSVVDSAVVDVQANQQALEEGAGLEEIEYIGPEGGCEDEDVNATNTCPNPTNFTE